jgi:hypothetical protein
MATLLYLKVDIYSNSHVEKKLNSYDRIITLIWKAWNHIKLVWPRHLLLKCLFQARKVSGHVYVCYVYVYVCYVCLFSLCFYLLIFFFIVFGTVSTVWYYLFYCFWNCFDSVVLFILLFLELFRQCGIIFLLFLELFRQCGIIFLLFLELFRQCGIIFFIVFGTVSTVWYYFFYFHCIIRRA